MSLSDPIGDMLSRIKNAQVRNHSKVSLPSSKFKAKIADVLKSEGYIIDYKINEEKKNIRRSMQKLVKRSEVGVLNATHPLENSNHRQ